MNKKVFITIGVIAVVAIGVFIYLNQSDRERCELETIRVAQFGEIFIYLPLYLADVKGFFADEGLRIQIINTGGDHQTFAAVIGGSATFGVADPTFVAIAQEQGMGGKVIASIVNGVPFWGVTNNHAIPEITDPAQLEGFSVATFASPSTAYMLQSEMFRSAGLNPNIRQGAFGTLWTMVEAGHADIALELEPNVSIAVNQGGKVLYSLAEIYGDFAIAGVMITEETARRRPELVQSFVNALQRAMKFAHTYPDKVIYYAEKIFPDIDRDISASAIKRIIDTNTFPQNVLISEEAWDRAVKLRMEAGDIRSLETARGVLDMSFARNAVEN